MTPPGEERPHGHGEVLSPRVFALVGRIYGREGEVKRFSRCFTLAASFALLIAMFAGTSGTASADALAQNFETFNTGTPNLQQGWTFVGPYDAAIADPNTFGVTDMGSRALRISNAVTSGSFGDWVFSAPLAEPAGESGKAHFEASFAIESTSTVEQPGLQFSLAPQSGFGARMSFLRFNDTPAGIDVYFEDYIDAHPLGASNTADGCGAGDDFALVKIASGLSRTVHQVRIAMDFLPGPANDRVMVYIDNALVHVGTSWEDYYRYCSESGPLSTPPNVDSLIFQARSGSGTAPATLGNGFLVDDVNLESGSISPVSATGAWTLYPPQGISYSAQSQQPINSANTSNWSAKSKGAIPVKFALSTQPGPPVFESIGSDADTANDYSFLSFAPNPGLTFGQIHRVKADYSFTLGNCHGGSLRWQIGTAAGNLFIYYGDLPNFTDCTTNSQSGVNMIGLSDARYDTSQLGGTFYDTYAHALSLIGGAPITYAALVLDSGWGGDQRLTPSNVNVNDNTFVPETGSPTPTCDLSPTAYVEVSELSPNANGSINEEPVQASLDDSGDIYRVVDCMYMYNLSIPSLKGAGLYRVEIQIPQGTVIGSAEFDLK